MVSKKLHFDCVPFLYVLEVPLVANLLFSLTLASRTPALSDETPSSYLDAGAPDGRPRVKPWHRRRRRSRSRYSGRPAVGD